MRFILKVLLLRRFFSSRPAMRIVFVSFLALLILGIIYAALVFNAVEKRMDTSHAPTHSTR